MKNTKINCPICQNPVTTKNNIGDYICKQEQHFVLLRGREKDVETIFLYLGSHYNYLYECTYVFDSGHLYIRHLRNEIAKKIINFDTANPFFPKTVEELKNFLIMS